MKYDILSEVIVKSEVESDEESLQRYSTSPK